ncbi:PPC domain-containing protein [Pseudogemmatithrix spongiicola]|uniref:PPC domain-containing protein n=1 Tax=Pseudogemmatithrix spongiicola TaxID=3062599 RepID=A0AA49K1V1_9BACT|nr:PPC domain-containing protein [Gemmatimonadaceae bacterium 'strain 138']WKW15848.1 PPC domain-containing protein [Gemmatimonadaceae bacterium 'strain 318']
MLAKRAAVLLTALVALSSGAARLQAQEPDFIVLSAYVEDAGGAPTLAPSRTINLVLIANNRGEGTARNARLRIELRAPGVAFVDDAGARMREVVLGDFGGRVSEQVFVPVVATERTGSIDIVVTPLYDGQRGAPVAQPFGFPTGFPGATVATQAPTTPSTPSRPAANPSTPPVTRGGAAPPRPTAGTRLSRAQILALEPDLSRVIAPNEPVSGTLGSQSLLLDDGTRVGVWYYQGSRGERITVTQTAGGFDSFLLLGRQGASRVLASDDDGGGGLNSRIRQTLPADDMYVIIANTIGSDASGNYTLQVESDRVPAAVTQGAGSNADARRGAALGGLLGAAAANTARGGASAGSERGAAAATSAAPMTAAQIFALPLDESRIVRMGATVQGALSASDLKLTDNTYLDVYYFNGFQGDKVSITLRSRAFDAYLHFGELGGSAAIATDDDGGSGTDARVSVTLPRTGTYVIIANALSAGGTGAYTLEVRSP